MCRTLCVPLRVHRPPLLVRYVCRTQHAAWHRRRSPPSSARQWRGWQYSSARSMRHDSSQHTCHRTAACGWARHVFHRMSARTSFAIVVVRSRSCTSSSGNPGPSRSAAFAFAWLVHRCPATSASGRTDLIFLFASSHATHLHVETTTHKQVRLVMASMDDCEPPPVHLTREITSVPAPCRTSSRPPWTSWDEECTRWYRDHGQRYRWENGVGSRSTGRAIPRRRGLGENNPPC